MKNKKFGEDGSVGLELLKGVSEIEEHANAVFQAVSEKYFTLEKALVLYKITKEEYLKFYK